ncbi:MAG: dihydropteroate synthase [Deltaproteobacteria bacterium]|nr:dihydropteroate synthase [Deltaproteobacteria bacterium]
MSRGAVQAVEHAAEAPVPLPAGHVCEIWGVLNITPDSFSDAGLFLDPGAALARAEAMLREGAQVIDVGGESSRPAGACYGEGFSEVPVAEELERVTPVVRALAHGGHRVSVDTVKPEVARAALHEGAQIINDVSCGRSHELLDVVAQAGSELVLMHTRGRGEVEPPFSVYADVVQDVLTELELAAQRAQRAGVARSKIWFDPGLGFAKTAAQSLSLLAALPTLVAAGPRVLVGSSRKSFLARFGSARDGARPAPGERLPASLASVLASARAGAQAVRVHDVAEAWQALSFDRALNEARTR